jgi:hypothetical protein
VIGLQCIALDSRPSPACKSLPASVKNDTATLTQTTNIQADNYFDHFGQTKFRNGNPTASCFNFFSTAQKKLKFLLTHIGTFAFALNHITQRKGKAKRANFANTLFKRIQTINIIIT